MARRPDPKRSRAARAKRYGSLASGSAPPAVCPERRLACKKKKTKESYHEHTSNTHAQTHGGGGEGGRLTSSRPRLAHARPGPRRLVPPAAPSPASLSPCRAPAAVDSPTARRLRQHALPTRRVPLLPGTRAPRPSPGRRRSPGRRPTRSRFAWAGRGPTRAGGSTRGECRCG